MATKQTALALTGTTNRTRTANPNTQSYAMQQIGQNWTALSGDDRASWEALAQMLATPGDLNMKPTHSAYGRFFAHNSALLSATQPTITTAPTAPAAVIVPPTTLTAGYVGPTPILTITPSTPFGGFKVLVYAAKPQNAGHGPLPERQYKQIGTLDSFAGLTNITALYQTRFRLRGPGYQISVKLIGIDSGGFRSAPVLATAVMTSGASNLTLE